MAAAEAPANNNDNLIMQSQTSIRSDEGAARFRGSDTQSADVNGLFLSLTSFSEELADNRTSCASKNSDSDSVIEVLLSLDTWCTRAGDSSADSCFWERHWLMSKSKSSVTLPKLEEEAVTKL